MMTQEDAERMKAYISAVWMGVADSHTEGGCDTCGYGGTSYSHMELEGVRDLVDDFVKSDANCAGDVTWSD